jgi:phospholipase C
MSTSAYCWASVLSICALPLAGCAGIKPSTTNTAVTYQLTVKATGNGTITSNPAGINCPTTCSASFNQNTMVTLTATPETNSFFGGWSGACSGTTNCAVNVNAPASVTATFNPGYGLTVALSGAGTVTSNPAGINCPASCSAAFPQNTNVTLTETPATNSFFSGWSGACSGTGACSVTVNASASVNANFSPGYGLTVAVSGSGSITSSPAGINCPGTCSNLFANNTQVTLSETPAANNVFSAWSGACTGTAGCSVTLSAATSVTASFIPGGTLQSLNHIVVFLQENRSFDHYFGALREYWAQNGIPDQSFDGLPQFNPPSGADPLQGPAPSIPGCDPSKPYPQYTSCYPDVNSPVTSFHMTSACTENPSPHWNESHEDWDYNDPIGTSPAQLNGFVKTAADIARQQLPHSLHDTNGLRAMGYFDGSDLNFYYFMASNFATSDRWFSPVMARTQLNRMYLLAATSAGHVYPLAPPYGPLTNTTIFQDLQNAGITWKIYVNPEGTGCQASDSACLIGYSYINMFSYEETILNTPSLLQNIVPVSQFATDVQNGTLPQVSLIEPASAAGLDEHPNDFDTSSPANVQAGAKYAESLITAFMASPSWKDSAMIFSYDEFGGLYDHVSPQPMPSPDGILPIDLQPGDICDAPGQLGTGTCNFNWTGYRVPMIVISPFAKKNFVSHTVRDFTAILNFIEKRFNLPALTMRDAAQADMSEFFDFVDVPWQTPPSPPAQSTSDECSLSPPTP